MLIKYSTALLSNNGVAQLGGRVVRRLPPSLLPEKKERKEKERRKRKKEKKLRERKKYIKRECESKLGGSYMQCQNLCFVAFSSLPFDLRFPH